MALRYYSSFIYDEEQGRGAPLPADPPSMCDGSYRRDGKFCIFCSVYFGGFCVCCNCVSKGKRMK